MTRLDIFIRKLILDAFSISHLEVSPSQEELLRKMIEETYDHEHYYAMSLDEKVKKITQSYRTRFFQRDQQMTPSHPS